MNMTQAGACLPPKITVRSLAAPQALCTTTTVPSSGITKEKSTAKSKQLTTNLLPLTINPLFIFIFNLTHFQRHVRLVFPGATLAWLF